MIDIFSIPLYYIAFNKNSGLEESLKKVGFKNINHFKAIDGRKMDTKQLLKDNIIGIRAYNDLTFGREQHTGLPSLGAVGCTLSHSSLWTMCANSMPYMTIVEEDLDLDYLSEDDIKNIQNALLDPKGIFMSSPFKEGTDFLFGTHLYFITQGAAKELAENTFPIELQTDSYIGYLNNTNRVKATGYPLSTQKMHKSSIQNICVKCFLPKGYIFYLIIVLGIILLLLFLVHIYKKLTKTKTELDSCRSSLRE